MRYAAVDRDVSAVAIGEAFELPDAVSALTKITIKGKDFSAKHD